MSSKWNSCPHDKLSGTTLENMNSSTTKDKQLVALYAQGKLGGRWGDFVHVQTGSLFGAMAKETNYIGHQVPTNFRGRKQIPVDLSELEESFLKSASTELRDRLSDGAHFLRISCNYADGCTGPSIWGMTLAAYNKLQESHIFVSDLPWSFAASLVHIVPHPHHCFPETVEAKAYWDEHGNLPECPTSSTNQIGAAVSTAINNNNNNNKGGVGSVARDSAPSSTGINAPRFVVGTKLSLYHHNIIMSHPLDTTNFPALTHQP